MDVFVECGRRESSPFFLGYPQRIFTVIHPLSLDPFPLKSGHGSGGEQTSHNEVKLIVVGDEGVQQGNGQGGRYGHLASDENVLVVPMEEKDDVRNGEKQNHPPDEVVVLDIRLREVAVKIDSE